MYVTWIKGNSLTYDFIDGEKELSFGKSTIYTTFRIDSDYTGTIFEVTEDDGTTTSLKWDGVHFYLSVKIKYRILFVRTSVLPHMKIGTI